MERYDINRPIEMVYSLGSWAYRRIMEAFELFNFFGVLVCILNWCMCVVKLDSKCATRKVNKYNRRVNG